MYVNLKKKYGQNFLIDKNILNKIKALIPNQKIKILEVGPGDGRLTDVILLNNSSNLTIVEIDKDLIADLNKKYNNNDLVSIINKDILKYEFNKYYDLIISNLPYNISSQVLVKISTLKNSPEKLIFMFQKEFAQRLLDKKINAINSLVRCFYTIKFEFNVSRNCFRPIPKVDSSILSFKKISKPLIDNCEIDNFINFKRSLFSFKRKSLKNVLKKYNLDNDFNLKLRVNELELDSLISIFRKINS
jgi:16S rRNA (adenine1518-N6/adenine1519-N6)-dimethyltransferase